MKKITILVVILMSIKTIGSAQSEWDEFEKIKNIKSSDAKELSQKITGEFEEELDKIKAIYYWVAKNVKYDYGIIEKRAKEKGKREKYTKAELEKKKKAEVAKTLKSKKGVCQHYSLLFEELCQYSEIESEFIGGLIKTRYGKINSHAWNAVKYKGEWQFIDVTYGSGSLNEKGKFIFKFDPNYFFINKEIFKINHFPKDSRWQLLENEIEKEEFISYLSIGSGYIEYGIKSLNRKEHKIEIEREEDLILAFKANQPIDNLICYKPSSGKRVEIKVEENDLNYKIQIKNSKIRNGHYTFACGTDVLFSYKIEKK